MGASLGNLNYGINDPLIRLKTVIQSCGRRKIEADEMTKPISPPDTLTRGFGQFVHR